jgi:hypothetical protein
MKESLRWVNFGRRFSSKVGHYCTPIHTLFEEAEVLLAYVFGSFLHTEASDDIDLAVLPGRRGLENLREKICETLSTQRVDLVNLKTASPLLRFEVLSTAHLRKSQARMLEERKKRWS